MPTKKPRVSVTINPADYKYLKGRADKEKISISSLIGMIILNWIEKSK
jgi:hypothetical protein